MNLLSVSAAAKQAGVDRKTVQRYLKAGKLKWHGQSTHGAQAKGIDPAELMPLVEGAGSDGKPRSSKKPLGLRLATFLKNEELDPGAVLDALIRAFEQGMDADLGAYCMDRLMQEDGVFLRMVVEGVNPRMALLAEPLRVHAAAKVREYATAVDPDALPGLPATEPSREAEPASLDERLAHLFRLWRKAPADVEPCIVVDMAEKTADIGLVPGWCRDAPAGLLPELGGKWSVFRMREGQGYKRVLPTIKTIADATVFSSDADAKERLVGLPVLLMVGGETVGNAWGEGRGDDETLKYLAGTLGIKAEAAKEFARYWRVLRGDALAEDRKHTASIEAAERHSDQAEIPELDEFDDGHGADGDGNRLAGAEARSDLQSESGADDIYGVIARPSDDTLCQVMGISRNTAREWIRRAG